MCYYLITRLVKELGRLRIMASARVEVEDNIAVLNAWTDEGLNCVASENFKSVDAAERYIMLELNAVWIAETGRDVRGDVLVVDYDFM